MFPSSRLCLFLLISWYNCGQADPHECEDKTFDCSNKDALRKICNSTVTQDFCQKSCGLCNVSVTLGQWGNWTASGPCSVTCGPGVQQFYRQCTSQLAPHKGISCIGNNTKTLSCSMPVCPVDGHWGQWEQWTICSATCNNGKKIRHRLCNNPSPAKGGKHCAGNHNERKVCAQNPCPVDGEWSRWGHWSKCSTTCGGGFMSRVRSCDHPLPTHGGKLCIGVSVETQACGTDRCQSCYDDWIAFDQHCYLIYKSKQLNWHDARNYCKRWHADLVEINSRAENDFLITKVHKIGGNYWIGATDKNRENNFKWVTSGNSLRNTFSHWCRNEPDDGRHHVKDCVLLKEHCGHKWSDDQCSDQRHFICEMTI